MRFSTILVSLALAVGMAAAAGPVVDRDDTTSLKAVEAPEPKADDVPTSGAPSPNGDSDESGDAVVVVGDGGKTVSKRGDINPLDERAYATLILCPRRGCKGYCYGYNLSYYQFNKCYFARHPFYSVYVNSHYGLGYGVYVGRHNRRYCNGMHFILF